MTRFPAAPDSSQARDQAHLGGLFGLAMAVLLGAWVRLAPVLAGDFPLNDGAMFLQMSREVLSHHFALPVFTDYNFSRIPFAYPPLGFYSCALLDALTPFSTLDGVRWLPALCSVLTIPVLFLLARSVWLDTEEAPITWLLAALSALSFALLPRSFGWMIMGGGLTRAPGFVFALLSLWRAHRLLRADKIEARDVAWLALCLSLTLLSHAEMTWFTAYSLGVMALFRARGANARRALGALCLAAAAAVVVTAPWWGLVIARHGIAPFLNAARSGGGAWYSEVSLNLAWEPVFPLLALVALAGAALMAARRQGFLIAWTIAIFVLQPRSARTMAMVPMALLIAFAVVAMVSRLHRLRPILAPAAAGVLLGFALFQAWLVGALLRQMRPLPPEERQAMAWVSHHTPPGSRFLILPVGGWAIDRASEWFPVLASRRSIATVQATEWLPNARFAHQWRADDDLLALAKDPTPLSRLPAWAARYGASWTHLYLPKGSSWRALNTQLRTSPRYRLIFDGPGAAIFEAK